MRCMSVGDLETVLDWAAEEGWNPGLDDARAFLAADPQGFLLAEERGAPVAAISVVNHSEDFAFLGLYICRPAYRGRGIGHALWRHALSHAGDRTVGLDGVPDQQANYVKSGFVHAGATTRFTGEIKGAETADLKSAREADIPQLISLEGRASGCEKPAYMTAWFSKSPTRTTFVLEEAGRIVGAVTVRACRSGAKIGPLIATDRSAAAVLIEQAALAVDGPISIDVPATSAPLARLCRDLGLTPGFHTARMYRNGSVIQNADWYAVATLELG